MNKYQQMLSCLLLILLPGCAGLPGAEPAPTATTEAAAPVNIQCTAAYRHSVSVEIEEETPVMLSQESQNAVVPFADLTFHATYLDPSPFEVPSLRIWVTQSEGEKEVTSVLYQLSNTQGLVNFTAGHGFTGLNYVYHPASGAELQYWCTAG